MGKMRKYCFWIVIGLLFYSHSALADLGAVAPYKDPASSNIVAVIEQVGAAQSIEKELFAVLQQFDRDKKECFEVVDQTIRAGCMEELFKLLEQAKALFQALNEQAQNVEAEITLVKEKLGDRHLDKLNRILDEVMAMRKNAGAEIKARKL